MKLSRNDLKTLVKECLVEILNEGLGEVQNAAPPPRGPIQDSPRRAPMVGEGKRRPHYNNNPALDQPAIQANAALSEAVRMESHGNPMMADILADTAATTYQSIGSTLGVGGSNPVMAQGSLPMSGVERLVRDHAPEELFGSEMTSKWADLAFIDSPKNHRKTS